MLSAVSGYSPTPCDVVSLPPPADSKFMAILRDSALYAPTFDKKLQRMLDRDYANPNFPTKHLLKDVRLFADVRGGAGGWC